jgi:hypothetical protein
MSNRSIDDAEVNLLQDLLPDQAYFTFATISIHASFERDGGYRTSSLKVRR